MADMHKLPWLHVYGQYREHSGATIIGTREGLAALRDAVDAALTSGTGNAAVFATDGEGYGLIVERASTVRSLGDPEYIYHASFKVADQEHKRDLEMKKLIEREKAKRKPEAGDG